MNEINEIVKTVILMNNQKESLKLQHQLGIMDSDGVRHELEMIKDKEKNLKQRLVLMSHVTAEGEPRSISHHEATPGNPKDYYVTKMPDGKKMKAVTYEGLIDKLYAHYTNGIKDYTVESNVNNLE